MRILVRDGMDNITKTAETLVDCLGFFEPVTRGARLAQPFAPCQVDQVQNALDLLSSKRVGSINAHCENTKDA